MNHAHAGGYTPNVSPIFAFVNWRQGLFLAGHVEQQPGFPIRFSLQHDPETKACSPGGEYGNFIMFARATSGDKPNNNRFSHCSVESMSRVMEVKARSSDGCFIRKLHR
jgi:disintegrin and metalloproteinase domain-containing protein 10